MIQSCTNINFFLFTIVIIQVASQTLWVDIDSGKVVGVSPGQNQQQQQRPQQQYPQQNNGNFHRRNRWRQQNAQPQPPFIQQPVDPTGTNINAEWVCRNSRTGDTMIIASEINNRTPELPQQQPNYQQPPIYNTDNPYQHNPWLDRNGQNLPQQNNPQGTLPNQNEQYPPNNGGNNLNNYPTIIQQTTTTEAPTKPPIILTSTKKPFPTFDNIDWTKYLETTTKKSSSQSLSRAIDGEGVIMARGGD